MSNSGIGWSWGIPGFRIGKGPTGATWISVGIPGTGFYFIKQLNKRNRIDTINQPDSTQQVRGNSSRNGIKRWHDLS
jgi:hypothetical protein